MTKTAPNPNWIKLGEIIKEARGNVSLQEFADMVGVSWMTISRLEKAAHKPDIDVLHALSKYTKYTTEQLVAIAVGKENPVALKAAVSGLQAHSLLKGMPHPEIEKLILLLSKELTKEERKSVMKQLIDIN